MRFTILGCGSSPGTPRIHGDWGACDPENPKNRRLRSSLLVERIGKGGKTTLVIDTGPDFRQQMLNARVSKLDGVIYTHPHADHTHGIDDLRGYALAQRQRIPVFADQPTLDKLNTSFGYCFAKPQDSMYPPILDPTIINHGEVFTVEGEGGPISTLPVPQVHGDIHSLGFRFGSFVGNKPNPGGLAYSADVSNIAQDQLENLRNLDVWIVDALQYQPHVSHFSLGEALEWIEILQPKKSYLTHMHIPLDYETVSAETPANVEPSYDGMTIELDVR